MRNLSRLEGVGLFGLKQLEDGQKALAEAIGIARSRQAKAFELRAAVSLARLWRDQGKVQQARELLAPIYGWFTEVRQARSEGSEGASQIAQRKPQIAF